MGVNETHLEKPIEITAVYPEIFDGHGAPQVYSVADFREAAMIFDSPDVNEFRVKNIRIGYDLLVFTDLGKEP